MCLTHQANITYYIGNNMNCKYHKIRTKKGIKYGYCTLYKKEVELFNCKCNEKEVKQYKHSFGNKTLLKTPKNAPTKSNKIKLLEKKRFSILTNDLNICYNCKKPKNNLHEVYEGIYRNTSMQYGCVLPLCTNCHYKIHHDYEFKIYYKRLMKKKFKEVYPELNFNELFYYKEKND